MFKELGPASRLFKLLPWTAGLLSLLFLLYSMDVLSRNIGFYWDEIWDYVPSVAMIRGDSLSGHQEIKLFHHPIPLVSGPYQGALKAWVAAPWIQLFGTSPHFILTLNVLFGMIYLLALYWALLPVIGKWAWVVFATPFLDTNFLLISPMDFGPSLFQFIFISLAMGALFRYLAYSAMEYYLLVWFFTGCILAQKLTAIPIAIGFIAITIAFSFRSLWKTACRFPLKTNAVSYGIVPALLFLVPMIPHLLYFWRSGFTDLFSMTADGIRGPYLDSLFRNLKYFHTMFDGVEWCRRITLDYSAPAGFPPVLFISGIVFLAASVVVVSASGREKKYGMPALAGAALFLCIFLIYPVFRGLNRPWHFFVMTPIFACCFIISFAHLLSYFANRWRRFTVCFLSLFVLCLALWIGFSTVHGLGVLRQIKSRKGVCLTSPAITDVYKALRAAGIEKIYGINYSIAFPIYVLSKGKIRAEELAWNDLTDEKIGELLDSVKENSETAMVYRFCGCKEGSRDWIRWLNREPQIFDLIERVDWERSAFDIKTVRDNRATDFVLIRKSMPSKAQPQPDRLWK
jgi:hypothetical protein